MLTQTQTDLSKIITDHIAPLIYPPGSQPSPEQTIGAAIGVYLNEGCYFFPFGLSRLGGSTPEDTTLFQLGSVTKVFTTSLLGSFPFTLGLDPKDFYSAPIAEYVPACFTLSDWEKAITFEQLATFTAGINPSTPKQQTQAAFIDFIDGLPDPGGLPAQDQYSDSSIGLLGQTLISMAGYQDFATAGDTDAWYWANLFGPLGMASSGHTPPIGARTASFYAYEAGEYNVVDQAAWVPWGTAGRCLSNVKDMLNFIQANLGVKEIDNRPVPGGLLEGMVQAQSPWAPMDDGNEQAFAWVRTAVQGQSMLFKNGGLPGTAAFIELCPDLKFGIIALANSGSDAGGSHDKMTIALETQVKIIMEKLIPLALP